MSTEVTNENLNRWATDMASAVALHLKQKLLPVEDVNGEGGVIFPPTYADIGYNIDTLSDGTKVATIDSVGSQANRIEPLFKAPLDDRDQWLVPPIEIVLRSEPCGECEACKNATSKNQKKAADCTSPRKVKRSIFDLAHRAADAVVQCSPDLANLVDKAFKSLQVGDAGPLCALAPTSLVFGVWDSRGGSGEKRPRLVRSIIRAWDVEPLHAAAQFNSVWKALSETQQEELKNEAKAKKTKLSEKGLADAPGVFRKTDRIPQYRDGGPNPDARVLGGVIARGRIEREVTVNLVALRGLHGKDDKETAAIRKYLLGLSLLAATADIELFLREGCHLRYSAEDDWYEVPRRGEPIKVSLPARDTIETYARTAVADDIKPNWPQKIEYEFNLAEAKKLLAKKTDEETAGGGG
jgi:CRISPR-associated protein Csb1